MLNKSEISAKVFEDFIEKHYEITGVWLDQRQAKLVMGLAVKQPLRTGAEIAKKENIPLEELVLDTPFGRLEYYKREVTTGGFGEKPTKVLDENGNQVYKYVPKMRFGKSVAEEVLSLSETADEETVARVNERLEKENNWVEPYKEDTLENEKWTTADHLSRELLATINKVLSNDLGIDIWGVYAKIKENEGLVDSVPVEKAKKEDKKASEAVDEEIDDIPDTAEKTEEVDEDDLD